ncbi:MAG: mechanosensitive ion channel [Thiotrichales bacterium]|nr:MAG: mechanosensitive ion channel [Thiotrichales bacterium]
MNAETQPVEGKPGNVEKAAKPENSLDSLEVIQQSIGTKRNSIRELEKQLKQLTDPAEKQEVEQKIGRIRNEISGLQRSFEHIALAGVNASILDEETEEKIDWREELEQISRPLISSLKEITAKPRQMDALRRDIEQHETRLELIDRALVSLLALGTQDLPAEVAEPITRLTGEWQLRREDNLRALEILRYKLDSLKVEKTTWRTSAKKLVSGFFLGRGLTLFLAAVAGISIWLVLKGLLMLYWRWVYRAKESIGIARAPLVIYSYRLFTAIMIVSAVLMVFYVRGDVLLITLALLALAGVALSLRQTLPRYTAEMRLLLGIGPVRESERLVYEGVPYQIDSLSIFTILRNPLLEGVLRLPLHDMSEMTSRQADDEPWFPCRPDDYILLSDGSLARVLRQSIEIVEVMIRDARVQIATADFLAQNIRNLSREGFGIPATFGIDYQHQAICLERVPAVLRKAITSRFDQAGFKNDIQDLVVEFKEAGSSSLDYQIYMIFNGRAAKAYYKAQRLVQQACVDACNAEGWVIPFTQVTVHAADAAGNRDASEIQQFGGVAPLDEQSPA